MLRGNVRHRTLLVSLALVWASLLASTSGVQAAPEPCPPGTPWDSLCNVEPELRRSYLLIEQVADLPWFRDRISGMVRDRKVTVEWDWHDLQRSHLGAFYSETNKVLIPAAVRGNTDRVEAAILAHELWHSYANLLGWHRPFSLQSCLQDEKEAWMVGMTFYLKIYALGSERPEPHNEIDVMMMSTLYRWWQLGGGTPALESLANEHLAVNGYLQHCARASAN